MARSAENVEIPFHSWLDFDTPLVWGLIFRAPSIQLFSFLYTSSIHEIVKKISLLASHTCSVQHMSAPAPGNDRNVCNILGDGHLASCCTMLRPRTFSKFSTFASPTGNLPILVNLPSGLLSFSNFWKDAKISWHAANSTHLISPSHSPCDQNGHRKGIFSWIIDLDL